MTTTPTPKVKPLEWEQVSPDEYRAKAPLFGLLRIWEWNGRFGVAYSTNDGPFIPLGFAGFPTSEAAKAAVQAEYDKAILACLEPLVEEA